MTTYSPWNYLTKRPKNMEINDKEIYTLYDLVKGKAFKLKSHTITSYLLFIGSQQTKGNQWDPTFKESKRVSRKIKGSDLRKFVENIK